MFSGLSEEYCSITIHNNGFWPDLNVGQFKEQRSIPSSIKDETALYSLLAAIGEINHELQPFVESQQKQGIQQAKELKGPEAQGINQLSAQYIKAVYARAKAELMGEITSAERDKANTSQTSAETRERLLAEAAYTLRNILGYKRIGIDLV